ncbi:MAG TPA: branched-chain amino acid ABC transporter permease [Limnochordales bacterium]
MQPSGAVVQSRRLTTRRTYRRWAGWLLAAGSVAWLAAAVAGTPGLAPSYLLSLALWGVMLGAVLGLGAIGLTLVYGVLRFANFAHGDLMTVGAYVALAVMGWLPRGAPLSPFSFGPEFLVALVAGAAGTVPVALAVDRLLLRPLRQRRSPSSVLAMASLGAAFFLRSLVYLGWGADFRFYYVGRRRPTLNLPLGLRLRPDQLFILVLALGLVVGVYYLLARTRLGKAMRATADNPELARISGIDTEQVARWTWVAGGALAGAAGVLLGLDAQLRPEMGWAMLLSLFAAVILGSIGNPYGALVGAVVLGVVQQVATAFVNPAYAAAVAFLILVAALLVRPQGLFGRAGG